MNKCSCGKTPQEHTQPCRGLDVWTECLIQKLDIAHWRQAIEDQKRQHGHAFSVGLPPNGVIAKPYSSDMNVAIELWKDICGDNSLYQMELNSSGVSFDGGKSEPEYQAIVYQTNQDDLAKTPHRKFPALVITIAYVITMLEKGK